MAKVKVEFAVTWKGSQEAELSYLLDGGVVVSLAGKLTIGAGQIIVSYLAGDTGLHPLEWGLAFPGRTLRGFVATATIANGAPQQLSAPGDDQNDKWISTGEAVG